MTWTLQIELLFYMVLLSWFSIGALQRPLLLTWGVLAIVASVCLPLKYSLPAEGTAWFGILTALDSVLILKTLPLFLIGILLNERRCGRGTWLWHGFAILGCGFVFHLVDQRDHNPVSTLVFTILLGLSAFGRVPVLRMRPIVFVAGISYSLYLLHNNLGSTLIYQLDPLVGPWPALCVSTGLVVAIATLSTYYLERPVSKWLRIKWNEYQQRQPAVAPQPPLAAMREFGG